MHESRAATHAPKYGPRCARSSGRRWGGRPVVRLGVHARGHINSQREQPSVGDGTRDQRCVALQATARAESDDAINDKVKTIEQGQRSRRIDIAAAPTLRKKLTLRRWYGFLRMQSRVAKRARMVLVPSESSRRDIVDTLGLRPERVSVVAPVRDGYYAEGSRILRAASRAALPLIPKS